MIGMTEPWLTNLDRGRVRGGDDFVLVDYVNIIMAVV